LPSCFLVIWSAAGEPALYCNVMHYEGPRSISTSPFSHAQVL